MTNRMKMAIVEASCGVIAMLYGMVIIRLTEVYVNKDLLVAASAFLVAEGIWHFFNE